MSNNPYFLGTENESTFYVDDGQDFMEMAENEKPKPYNPKPLISFAETDEDRKKAQQEIDANKDKIEASKKLYLILFAGYFGDSEEIDYKQWDFAQGREDAYRIIKETFLTPELKEKNVTLDAYESRIIVQTNSTKLKLTGISVYKFVSTMIREGKIVDDDGTFDIEEWAVDAQNKED